ncbi:hydantoinase/oxoprolinase family protein [Amycolatopsis jejuensis]|uniref:hydantoinase/oxoprolinase family protein n=1 Tax=Amycolatopsis jejuensis TaxID=330084 RepID=UPI000526D412|nr:hydantoinase/oxoprolinase family protein [Amycolatopsis jejuensis]
MATRIGVDVGGTFTDLVFYDDETGTTHVAKGPSDPARPDAGVLAVVSEAVAPETLGRAEYFLHGTTVGLNSLLERTGARVGLLATAGFRDVLELRRSTRDEPYDIFYQPQPVLVPRRLRAEVAGRIGADGAELAPLAAADVRAALKEFQSEGVESIAVCFLHAHVEPRHELEAERILREAGFAGAITLSHRVSREMNEFERTSTSVVDAYVRPAVSTYLHRLDEGLRAAGFAGQSLITRSGGGSLPFAEAQERPFETVMSGPVAGAVGAGKLARALGLDRAITADVGGTSFDTALLQDGRPLVAYQGVVGDLPLQTPWVDVRSIGSGGGSLAVAEGDRLRVGPESAGAVPGPVCYGRGGDRPTTTDAAAVLGMLAFGELAGGLQLDLPAAERALDRLAGELGTTNRDDVAAGIIRIAAAAMAGAVRTVTIEQGEDPRDAALIAYGGAGPMLASVIAGELDIATIVVPEHAGNFSAFGLLSQEVTRSRSATLVRPADAAGIAAAHALAVDLIGEIEAPAPAATTSEFILEMRYSGQFHSLAVPWDDDAVVKVFEKHYEKAFGHTFDGPVEIVAVRATVREGLPALGTAARRNDPAAKLRHCEAYSFALGHRTEFAVRDRATLTAEPVPGPVIVLEPTTTTYVDAGRHVRIGPHAAMLITTEGGTR